MSELRTIEIDFEVNKLIEIERRSFSEPHNAALRRLLRLPDASPATAAARGRPWSGKGVSLPHGTEVRMEYNGRVHTGSIDDGEWLVEGTRYNSPSAAAGGVARTKGGKPTSLDGWIYWHARRPGETKWTPISQYRNGHPG